MNTSVRPRLLAALLLPLALALGGCSLLPGGGLPGASAPDELDDEALEEYVEGSTGLDVEVGTLPAGFPAGAVPLVEGEIVLGFPIPGSGPDAKDAWQVTIVVPDEATAESSVRLLESAGYVNETIGWENGSYLVVVSWAEADDAWQLSYIVAEQ